MEYMTVREVATMLRVSEHTINRWCRLGMLTATRAGKAWRIRPADLESFLERRQQPPERQQNSTLVFLH